MLLQMLLSLFLQKLRNYVKWLKPSLRLKTQPYIFRPATDCSCRLHLGGNKSHKLEPITKQSQPRVALARHQRSYDLFCRLAGKKQSATEWKTAVTRSTSGGRQGISGIGVAAPHDLFKIVALKLKQNSSFTLIARLEYFLCEILKFLKNSNTHYIFL